MGQAGEVVMLRVRYERLRRGWTQTEVAARIGTSTGWISDYERGSATGKRIGRTVRALARLYGVEPKELFQLVSVPAELGVDLASWLRHLAREGQNRQQNELQNGG